MLSAVQNVNAIQYWLNEFLRIVLIRKTGFSIPRSVVCDFDFDFDMALLNARAKAFGQHFNLKHLSTYFIIILNEQNKKAKMFYTSRCLPLYAYDIEVEMFLTIKM